MTTLASTRRSYSAADAPPPPSGTRRIVPRRANDAIRALAREAESLDLDPLAFELFFIATRLESTDRVDLARQDLDAARREASEVEARFYALAVRALGDGPRHGTT